MGRSLRRQSRLGKKRKNEERRRQTSFLNNLPLSIPLKTISLITLLVVSDKKYLNTIIHQQLPPSWVILSTSKGTIIKLKENEDSLPPIVEWSIMINNELKCFLSYCGTDDTARTCCQCR